MYRILFYNYQNNSEAEDSAAVQKPICWFDGLYNWNEIPYPILYSKERLVSLVTKEIILEKGQRFVELELNQLLRIESTQQGSLLFLENKAFWTTEKSIDRFYSDLKFHLFFRVNKNHLVSLNHVKQLIKCDGMIILSNMDTIPVNEFEAEQMLKFLEGKQMI